MPKLKSQNRKESLELMKTYRNIILGSMLIFMLSVSLVACGGKTAKTDPWSHAKYTESIEFGEGAKTVTVVVQVEEHAIDFVLHTDKENLEEALLELESRGIPYEEVSTMEEAMPANAASLVIMDADNDAEPLIR